MVADLCHVVISCFRGEKAPRENPPKGDFFVFSHGDLSPRHTKVRHFSCVAFSPLVCRIFARRGERSPREKHAKITYWRVFAWRPFAFSPRKHVYATWHKSATLTIKYTFTYKHVNPYPVSILNKYTFPYTYVNPYVLYRDKSAIKGLNLCVCYYGKLCCSLNHPRIPRGDSARYSNPWDN